MSNGKENKDQGHGHGYEDGGWHGSHGSVGYKPGKGVVLLVLALGMLGVSIAAFFFWYVPSVGLKSIHPMLPYAAGAVVLAATVFILAGMFAVSLSLIGGHGFKSLRFRGLLIKFFLPLMVMVGGLLKIPRIKIEKAFIQMNNDMVRQMVKKMCEKGRSFSPNKILILMPHCIQYDDCRLKVTREIRNCAGCGKCEIGDLIGLAERYDMEIFVLTGGTVARRRLYEYSPDAVVAVACERDLTSGVQDAYPLPVMGVVNKRPHGYCMETGVAVEEIRDAIEDLLGAAPSPEPAAGTAA